MSAELVPRAAGAVSSVSTRSARCELRLPPPEVEGVGKGLSRRRLRRRCSGRPGRRVEVEKGKFGYNNEQILAAKFEMQQGNRWGRKPQLKFDVSVDLTIQKLHV